MKVSLFITCLGDTVCPEAGVAAVRLLRRHGCDVDFPAGQTCCGQPFFNNGHFGDARDLAARMLDIFAESEYVVAPSGSCAAMVREHFPMLFTQEPEKSRAAAMAAKTYELVEFLTKVLKVSAVPGRAPGKVTYHYSCHLRGLGQRDEAPRLLAGLAGTGFVPMEKHDQCCGFGGTFSVKMGEISSSMVREKVRCITASGADIVTSCDAGCLMNIAGALSRAGSSCRAVHIAELLAGEVGEVSGNRGIEV